MIRIAIAALLASAIPASAFAAASALAAGPGGR